MPLLIQIELDAAIAALYLRACVQEAAVEGYQEALHLRPPGGPNLVELRRGEEIVTIRSDDTRGHQVRIEVESETQDVSPLVDRSAVRAVASFLIDLARGVGGNVGADPVRWIEDQVLAPLRPTGGPKPLEIGQEAG